MDACADLLEGLTAEFSVVPESRLAQFFKVYHLTLLQRRWRLCELDTNGRTEPIYYFRRLVSETIAAFHQALETMYLENNDPYLITQRQLAPPQGGVLARDDSHQKLFNSAFPSTHDRTNRERHRKTIRELMTSSGLADLIAGKRTLELGCGPAEWLAVYLEMGAAFSVGVDFGGDTLSVAKRSLTEEGWMNRFELVESSVYELPFANETFDLVGQMGVFHHLEDEDRAIREATRVLRPGGTLVYATAGQGGIRNALQDCIWRLLRSVPADFMLHVYQCMGISPEHTFYLIDAFKADYRRTTWDEITERLHKFGYQDFRRMKNVIRRAKTGHSSAPKTGHRVGGIGRKNPLVRTYWQVV